MISQHDIGGCDDRICLDRIGRASTTCAVRAANAIDQTELNRSHTQQCGDHVAGMAAFSIMQILVDQRENTDQSVKAQCVAGSFVGAILAEDDSYIWVEPFT